LILKQRRIRDYCATRGGLENRFRHVGNGGGREKHIGRKKHPRFESFETELPIFAWRNRFRNVLLSLSQILT
jgi:hypothetical protein